MDNKARVSGILKSNSTDWTRQVGLGILKFLCLCIDNAVNGVWRKTQICKVNMKSSTLLSKQNHCHLGQLAN